MMFEARDGKLFDAETGEQFSQDVTDSFHVAFMRRFDRITPFDLAIIGGWKSVRRDLEERLGDT